VITARLALVAAIVGLALPRGAAAQFCFRSGRAPKCKSQAVTEFMIGARFKEVDPLAENLLVASSELGVLVNAGSRSAFGGTVLAGVNGGGTRLGLKGRYRHCLSETVALDVSPGILVAGTTSSSLGNMSTPGFTGHVGVTWKDWAGLSVQYESVRFDDGLGAEQTDASVVVGARMGSSAGIVSSVLALGFVIVYVVAAGNTQYQERR